VKTATVISQWDRGRLGLPAAFDPAGLQITETKGNEIMIRRKIFTKRFFQLSEVDQAAVVSAVIRDIEDAIGRHLEPIHDRQAEQRVKRIRARANKHGIDGV
jgi:hypothetical protein